MRPQISVLLLAMLPAAACGGATAGNASHDQPLSPARVAMLDLAFRTASALPVDPHAKTRSRLQEAVVKACLRLDQPGRAAGCAEAIADWRRGSAYATIANYHVQRGARADAEHYLELAAQVSERADVRGDEQEWRRDRIRVGIAEAYVRLGQAQKAEPFATGAVEHERGRLDAVRATVSAPAALDAWLTDIEGALTKGDLDRQRYAVATAIQIVTRCWDDAARRSRAEGLIKSALVKLPPAIGFDTLIALADLALDKGDRAGAVAFAADARRIVEQNTCWRPEDRISLGARLAGLLRRIGDRAAATREMEAALTLFDAERARIVDIDRARLFRAIAEAWQAMGDTTAALAAYRTAVEEGVENPNSRPRAEDLCATLCSMATSGVEPDADLNHRMHQIFARLGHPW